MYADNTTICYSSDDIEDFNAVVNAEITCLIIIMIMIIIMIIIIIIIYLFKVGMIR